MLRPRSWRSLIVAIFALLVSGCGSRNTTDPDALPTSSTGRQSVSAARTSVSTSSVAESDSELFPLAPLLARGSEVAAAFESALDARLATCMKKRGFDYVAEDDSESRVSDATRAFLSRRYGGPVVRDDGIAGYAFDDSSRPTEHSQQQPSREYLEALTGDVASVDSIPIHDANGVVSGAILVSPQSCQGISLAELFGGLDHYAEYTQALRLVESIAADSYSRLFSDEAAVQASQDWARCMAESGFSGGSNGTYKTPLDVSNQDWESPRPGALEQATARADLVCREGTGVDERLASLEAARQRELLEQYPDLITTLDAFQTSLILSADK